MKIDRKFTIKGESPYKTITFKKVKSEIKNPDGSVIFKLNDVEVPTKWSQVATDIIAQKYFRKKEENGETNHKLFKKLQSIFV